MQNSRVLIQSGLKLCANPAISAQVTNYSFSEMPVITNIIASHIMNTCFDEKTILNKIYA